MSEEDENKFYVYIYYDRSRHNEPIYVGKGHGNRAWQHLSIKKTHPFIQRLQFMKRNGTPVLLGFYSCLDEELAHLLEQELISYFGRKDLGKGPLLNLTDGGEGSFGLKISDWTKLKLSLAKKGKPKLHRHVNSAHRGTVKEKQTCPHCNKIGGAGAMQRWHFDNCRKGKINV
jgi:hypothetical protein